jgi:hypothetical protein
MHCCKRGLVLEVAGEPWCLDHGPTLEFVKIALHRLTKRIHDRDGYDIVEDDDPVCK